jgi:hypothetical protein
VNGDAIDDSVTHCDVLHPGVSGSSPVRVGVNHQMLWAAPGGLSTAGVNIIHVRPPLHNTWHIILELITGLCYRNATIWCQISGKFRFCQPECSDRQNRHLLLQVYRQEVNIMSLKSPQKLDLDELQFINELGWLATFSISISSFAINFPPFA